MILELKQNQEAIQVKLRSAEDRIAKLEKSVTAIENDKQTLHSQNGELETRLNEHAQRLEAIESQKQVPNKTAPHVTSTQQVMCEMPDTPASKVPQKRPRSKPREASPTEFPLLQRPVIPHGHRQ